MTLPDGAASIWTVATRLCKLDQFGTPASGADSWTTSQAMKLTFAPVLETGDDIVVRNANGDLVVFAKKGDMPKRYSIQLDFATPDPGIEEAVAGGVLLGDSSSALGTPSFTAVGQTTLGGLPAGIHAYRVTQYSVYGESLAAAEIDVTTTGTTSRVVIVPTFAAGALGARVYGRTPGQEQLMAGVVPNIVGQATTAASGTGAVSSLAVSGGLTAPIPQGTTFQIAGDTNTPKIVFTATAEVGIGAETIPVSVSQTVTTTIAAGAILPCYVDDGVAVPEGALPTADNSAGPGPYTGYQAPPLGIVGNPDGVSIECWQKAIIGGSWSRYLPYYRWVFPMCKNLHQTQRDLTNANTANLYDGDIFENPNWGSGPFLDWPSDSSKVFQRIRVGSEAVPVPSLSPTGALV